ncbi:hypothetical protein K461DRAFT_291365 [Myriangium duriaei CBS 260.36]|uniref:Uncharacterized protein n=1 Tax=Myriangium duriaei CBS 260.36 TaxID=1168546 RepID=A0A9P4J7F7_9PEZI|nr:hypothetical protein K461DRAFT_291365 [Myriangium duriaei CBS 260.36]
MTPGPPLHNLTILVPDGSTQHGNDHILCLPISAHYWPSVAAVILFFLANYFAHAATVKSSPGDGNLVQCCNAFLALLFPMSGLLRSLNAIVRNLEPAENELDKALKAGALCMVVRERHWRPRMSQEIQVGVIDHCTSADAIADTTTESITNSAADSTGNQSANATGDDYDISSTTGNRADGANIIHANLVTYLPSYARERSTRWVHFDSVWARARVDLRITRVHGTFELPDGYGFAIVPRTTCLISQVAASSLKDKQLTTDVSATYSALKAVASILQVIAAFTTLLSHRSDLLRRWGYASYHLTVIPYLFMTFVNLISNLMTPDYPCLYMVRTETMTEAERYGGRFEGEVAQTITLTRTSQLHLQDNPMWEGLTVQRINEVLHNDFSVLNLSLGAGFALPVVAVNFWIPKFLLRRMLPRSLVEEVAVRTSAKNARPVNLEVFQLSDEVTGNMIDSPGPDPSEQPSTSNHVGAHAPDVERQSRGNASPDHHNDSADILARTSNETFRLLIPHAPKSTIGEGFLYTIRSALKSTTPAYDPSECIYAEMMKTTKENNIRFKSKSKPSRWHRFQMLYTLSVLQLLVPMGSDDDEVVAPTTRRATVYYPSCGRFLRSDDLERNQPTTKVKNVIRRKTSRRESERDAPPTPQPATPDAQDTGDAIPLDVMPSTHGSGGNATAPSQTDPEPVVPQQPEVIIATGRFATGVGPRMLFYLSTKTQTRVHTRWAVVVEVSVGICIIGLFVGLVGGLSKFKPGQSSAIERGVMMAWLASGLYGFCLPLLSTWELLRALFFFPLRLLIMEYSGGLLQRKYGIMAFVLASFPLGIFIPPIWGFVLVGRMLVEWGGCIHLF